VKPRASSGKERIIGGFNRVREIIGEGMDRILRDKKEFLSENTYEAFDSEKRDLEEYVRENYVPYIKERRDTYIRGERSIDEIVEMMKFGISYSIVGHRGHERITEEPYVRHPERATLLLNGYNVGYTGYIAEMLHDIVEERAKKELKPDDPAYRNKVTAMFYSIGLEFYNFVKNNDKIKNKDSFYKDIKVIMTIIKNLTRDPGKTYLRYLYDQIFYWDMPDSVSITEVTPLDVLPHYGKFKYVKDKEQFVKEYIDKVDKIKLTKDYIERIKRRTMHGKIADDLSNLRDMPRKYFGIPKRLFAEWKSLVIVHEESFKERKIKKGYLKKISKQAGELRAEALKQCQEDIIYLGDKGFVSKEDREGLNKELTDYMATKDFHTITSAGSGSIFDGTIYRYMRMLLDNKEGLVAEKDYLTQYQDLILLEAILKSEQIIKNFSLVNLKDKTAEDFRNMVEKD